MGGRAARRGRKPSADGPYPLYGSARCGSDEDHSEGAATGTTAARRARVMRVRAGGDFPIPWRLPHLGGRGNEARQDEGNKTKQRAEQAPAFLRDSNTGGASSAPTAMFFLLLFLLTANR